MFDQEAYRTGVLDPARANGDLAPEDLFVRYAIDPTRPLPPAEFERHVEAVARFWPTLRGKVRYNKLLAVLDHEHRSLRSAGQLTWAYFEGMHHARTKRLREQLRERISQLAATTSVVSTDTVTHLVNGAGGPGAEGVVSQMLDEARIRVIAEPWSVPTEPPSPKARDVRDNVRQCGRRLSVELLRDTRPRFRLRPELSLLDDSGVPVPLDVRAAVTAARARVSRWARDGRQTAAENVLSILDAVTGTPDGYPRLLLWEVAEALRPHVRARLPVRVVAREAVELGLDDAQAEELAYAMSEVPGSGHARAGARVEAHLRAGELRSAQRELIGISGPEEAELAARVREVADRVDTLVAQAARERSEGALERAAELLNLALREAGDDTEIAGQFRAIPPPPVSDVRAGTGSGTPTVAWTTSAARVGTVTYRIVRTRGRAAGSPSDGTPVEAGERNEGADRDAPTGTDLFYTVFATRDGTVWSKGAWTGPVDYLPGIRDPRVASGDDEISARWWAHPEATVAEVIREPGGVVVEAADPRRFVDRAVTAGIGYRYLIRVGYPQPGGGVNWSAVTVLKAGVNQVEPVHVPPIADLAHRRAGDRLRLGWTWPPEVVTARVFWWSGLRGADGTPPANADVRHLDCWKTTYEANGGLELTVGFGAVTVAVRGLVRTQRGEALGEPTVTQANGVGVRVHVRFVTTGLPWMRRSRVILEAAQPCRLPPVVVVCRAGRVMPLAPGEGQAIKHIPAQDMSPDREVVEPIDLPSSHGEYRLACFPDEADNDDVVLVVGVQPGARGAKWVR